LAEEPEIPNPEPRVNAVLTVAFVAVKVGLKGLAVQAVPFEDKVHLTTCPQLTPTKKMLRRSVRKRVLKFLLGDLKEVDFVWYKDDMFMFCLKYKVRFVSVS
jgi:hypothetical protein